MASDFEMKDTYTGMKDPKTFIFKQSARISTYLYAIVAGPYDYFESN